MTCPRCGADDCINPDGKYCDYNCIIRAQAELTRMTEIAQHLAWLHLQRMGNKLAIQCGMDEVMNFWPDWIPDNDCVEHISKIWPDYQPRVKK